MASRTDRYAGARGLGAAACRRADRRPGRLAMVADHPHGRCGAGDADQRRAGAAAAPAEQAPSPQPAATEAPAPQAPPQPAARQEAPTPAPAAPSPKAHPQKVAPQPTPAAKAKPTPAPSEDWTALAATLTAPVAGDRRPSVVGPARAVAAEPGGAGQDRRRRLERHLRRRHDLAGRRVATAVEPELRRAGRRRHGQGDVQADGERPAGRLARRRRRPTRPIRR